jgi:hypothetical protein
MDRECVLGLQNWRQTVPAFVQDCAEASLRGLKVSCPPSSRLGQA